MKAIKLPRKLKKSLKSEMLIPIDPAWRTRDLKIKDYSNNFRKTGKHKVTSWELGRN